MTPNEKAQKDYKDAKEALNNIAHSLKATDEQRKKAIEAREKLIDDFIDKQISEIKKLTEKYNEFIIDMKDVIDKIGKDSSLGALKELKDIVDQASVLGRSCRQKLKE